MKQLIKIAGLIIGSTLFADNSIYLNSDEIIALEANAPEGVEISPNGKVLEHGTKAMIDENRPVGGTSIRYYSSTASAMQSINQNEYDYRGAGCTSSTSGVGEFDEALDLPDGTKIVSFSAFGKDSSSTAEASATLSRITAQGNYVIIKSYRSGVSQQSGRFNIGGFLNHTLSSSEGQLVRLRSSGLVSPVIELCGFRIGYVPPNVADDIIFVNNFYR